MSVDHYENFPVASWLCPPALRPAITAIYHFARTADDLADEGDDPPATRLQVLAAYRQDLVAITTGRPPGERWARVFRPLAVQMQAQSLPSALLHALLDAFEQDVRNPTYATRDEVLDYCSRSANPIGRLLLHLYDIDDDRSLRQSDAICTALQLINFWQDLSVDGPRHRHYVATADRERHSVALQSLQACTDSPAARALVADLCDWAQALMRAGAPLATRVPGRSGWELRLVVQGGLRILEKIRAMDHAALLHRPTLHATDAPRLLWRAWRISDVA